MNWIECKVAVEAINESGMPQKEHRYYLLNAVTVAEAEERIHRELSTTTEKHEVESVKVVKYAEVYRSGGNKYYKARLGFLTLNEKNGVEKVNYVNVLVQADDFEDAHEDIKKRLSSTLSAWSIYSLTETPLVDIYDEELG